MKYPGRQFATRSVLIIAFAFLILTATACKNILEDCVDRDDCRSQELRLEKINAELEDCWGPYDEAHIERCLEDFETAVEVGDIGYPEATRFALEMANINAELENPGIDDEETENPPVSDEELANPLENRLSLTDTNAEPVDCTRHWTGILNDDGSYATTADGEYIAGTVYIGCSYQLSATAVWETSFSPGYILCQARIGGTYRSVYEVTNWGAMEVQITVDNEDVLKWFVDYDRDYEPDEAPGAEDGWYPPFECALADSADGDILSSPVLVPCHNPTSYTEENPMPLDACVSGFASDSALLQADYTVLE